MPINIVVGSLKTTLFAVIRAQYVAQRHDKEKIFKWWSEHFQILCRATNETNNDTVNGIPRRPIKADLDSDLTTEEVVKATINFLNTVEGDEVPPEKWKYYIQSFVSCLLRAGKKVHYRKI